MMEFKIAQVIGLNTDQKAAQVMFTPGGKENAFLAVLDLACDDAFTKGRQILSELSDIYFDFEGTPAEKLKAVFDKAKEKFTVEDYSLLVASISGKILYLISKGAVVVYLKRGDKLSVLTSVGQEQLVSGFLQSEDKLLFSTNSLADFLGEDLEKSFHLPLETFEEEVSDRIGASNLENQGLAGLALEIKQEELGVAEPEKDAILNLEPGQTVYEDTNEPVSGHPRRAKFFGVLKKYFPKSGRSKLIVAVILIVILASGIGFKAISSRNARITAEFNQALSRARDDFNSSKDLASLNPADAKSRLDRAKEQINKALALKPKNNDALNLKNQIEEQSGSILQQSAVSEFPLFLDMDLVKKNFRSSRLSLSSGKLLLLDPDIKTLAIVDLDKKSNQILAGESQLGNASLASLNGGLAFVYSQDKGILKIDTTNQKLAGVSKKDSDWGSIADLTGFAGNIYLLDSDKNQIWKYLPASGGYSDKREYLSKNTKANLSGIVRMQIESSLYVLRKDGEMLRFTKGEKDNFSYGGLDKGVKDPKSFFVSSDTDNLYVLDSGNSRLLVLTKTGSYKGQISGSKFASASDLAVDEKGKKVYLLDGGKIYTADLK